LLENVSGKVKQELTDEVRKQLRQFGVYVHRVCLTELSPCRVFKLVGQGGTSPTFNVEGV
jgi:hypothetical protein